MSSTASNNILPPRKQSTGGNSLPTGGFSPKGERKVLPNSMGNISPITMRPPTTQIEKIEEENSDNEGEGAASIHLKKNNYDKSK